jgi:hypothetical protein
MRCAWISFFFFFFSFHQILRYMVRADFDFAHWSECDIGRFMSKKRDFIGKNTTSVRDKRTVQLAVDATSGWEWSIVGDSPIVHKATGDVVGCAPPPPHTHTHTRTHTLTLTHTRTHTHTHTHTHTQVRAACECHRRAHRDVCSHFSWSTAVRRACTQQFAHREGVSLSLFFLIIF